MNENNNVAHNATNRRTMTLSKMSKSLSLLHKSISNITKDETKLVEATAVANETGFMLNFLGEDFNLSINLVVMKGGQ